jgi:hypothetical protein
VRNSTPHCATSFSGFRSPDFSDATIYKKSDKIFVQKNLAISQHSILFYKNKTEYEADDILVQFKNAKC